MLIIVSFFSSVSRPRMKSQCPEYFIRNEWVIMPRVTPVTASYSPLLPTAPEVQQLHAMYTLSIGCSCCRDSQQTNSGKAEVCHVLASEHH